MPSTDFHSFCSERAKQHEVVVALGKPRSHVLMLGIRKGLRDGFVASAEYELVGRRGCSKQIDGGRVAALLPDDDIVIVVWGGAIAHRPAISRLSPVGHLRWL